MDISFWVIFQIRKENQEIKGNLQDFKDLSIANHVDEIYVLE
jgi:hypothetical protein